MEQRTNQGYTIIASITLPEQEYVLGEKQTNNGEHKYVTWCCVNGTDYYHGHYIDDKKVAIKDMYERAFHEIAYRIDRLNDSIKAVNKQ